MEDRKNSYPTSKDVARTAGISQSTVSLIMNGKDKGRVSGETRAKVIKTAEELGYKINTAARNLRLGSSNTIAFVVPNIENPFYIPAIKRATEILRNHGYTLLLIDVGHDLDWMKTVLNTQASQAIDGFILFSLDLKEEEIPHYIKGKFIAIDSDIDSIPSISLSFYSSVKEALRYLLDLGHQYIAHVTLDVNRKTLVERRRAYQDVMLESNIPINPQLYVKSMFSKDHTTKVIENLLSTHSEITAIFCDDDLFAVNVYKAARNLGIAIPEELSVLSINDTYIAQVLMPELTAISINSAELGELGALAIIKLLKGDSIINDSHVDLSLIVRGSTASAKSGG